jgi:TonB-linked SusC/RagA family outer membrane protein
MRQRLCLIALVAAFLMVTGVGAQQITGTVKDAQTGQPMSAVQVFIQGTGIGALTQNNGRYLLLNVPAGPHQVTAQRIGFKANTQQVTVAAGQTVTVDFGLAEEALGLDEIIVTGTPGATQRRAIGNTVASVAASSLTQTVATPDVKDLLRGRTAGVTLGAGGAIGQGADITIRGGGSFDRTRSNPIVFVDGVRVNTNPAGPVMAQGAGKSNPMDDFNPADIESVEIIKGPAAATLYGSEASAGVIQIITKKGKQGSAKFNASVSQGRAFNRAPQDKLGTMWACTDGIAIPCKGGASKITPYSYIHLIDYALHDGTLNPYWSNNANGACGADACWPQSNLFQYGPTYNYNLDVNGATDKIRYFLSGNKQRSEGPTFFNYDGASRFRTNVGVVFSDQFTLDVSSGYINGQTSYDAQAGSRGGTWDQMVWGQGYCAPTIAENSANACPRTLGMQQFLPTDQSPITSTRDYDRFTGSGTLNYKTGNWFTSRAIVGIDRNWDKNTWIHPIEVRQTNVIQERLNGQIVLEKPTNTNASVDVSGTINKTFRGIATSTSVGGQYYKKTYELFSNTGNNFASPLSTTINQTPVTSALINYQYTENKSLGLFAQEQIGLRDRLFLTGALRFDDNSAFGSDFKPLVYPKLSASWVVSEESFWKVPAVQTFRLRGAWGKAGRQPDVLAGVNTFTTFSGPGGTSALAPGNTGNPDVGPEKSTELEVGFEASAFSNRVNADFSWYNRVNEGNLLGISLPPSLGQGGSVQKNVGTIKNWGWEASLNTRVVRTADVEFNLDFTGAYKMNRIDEIGSYPGNSNIKIGWPWPNRTVQFILTDAKYDNNGPIVDPYGKKIQAYCDPGTMPAAATGVDPRVSKYGPVMGAASVPCQQTGGYRVLIGPAFQPYTWTISPQLTLRNTLTFHILLDGSYGGVGQDQMSLWHHRYNTAYGTMLYDNPEYYAGYKLDQWAAMEWYKRDFWKWREFGVRYQLPDVMVRRMGASRGALTFSGNELATLWTDNTGTGIYPSLKTLNQPESTILDVDFGRSADGDGGHRSDPPISQFTFRIDLTF